MEQLVLEPPRWGEVLVEMWASGVCHSDLHVVEGEWSSDHLPLVLGHEGCGVVREIGPGVDSGLLGKRVVLSWLAPCLECPDCQAGKQWLCRNTRALENMLPDGTTPLRRSDGSQVFPYLGLGTFAEAAVVPARAAIPVPDELPAEIGALIGCCVSTGAGAVLRAARAYPGCSAVVIGLGGVGLSIVMALVLAGAHKIVAVDQAAEKLALAKRLGATDEVLAAADPVSAVLKAVPEGAEFAFEAVGLRETIEQSIRCLRPGGTAVLVGMAPFETTSHFDAFDFVDRSLSVIGVNYGFAIPVVDFPRYSDLYLAGHLPIEQLIETRIELEGVNGALEAMRRGRGARRVITYAAATGSRT